MRKSLRFVLAGLGAVTLNGAAVAGSRDTHSMNVALPDGSVAHVEYVGSVPPKVTVSPEPLARKWSPFGMFGGSAFGVERQIETMMQQIGVLARVPVPGGPGMNVAAQGGVPAGSDSVTIVTTINGRTTCTRRTDVTSQGPGRAPRVTSSLSGDCARASSPPGSSGNPI